MQPLLAPRVRQREKQDYDEYKHFYERVEPEPVRGHGPRQQKRRLHVEDDEGQSDEVEPDVEPDPGRADGGDAALVSAELYLTRALGPDEERRADGDPDEGYSEEYEKGHERVIGEQVNSPFSTVKYRGKV